MIKAVGSITGHVRNTQRVKGKVNNTVIKIYPVQEDLEIMPSVEEQVYDGSYKKVTVAGDSNLVAENIKSGTSIFGVNGTAKTSNAKITDASYLFYNGARIDCVNELLGLCENLKNMQYMFYNNQNITELDLSNLDTKNVTSMYNMFCMCTNLTTLDISNFDTSKVTTMDSMFATCYKLTELDLSHFDTSNVTNIRFMFKQSSALVTLNLSSFDMGKVTNIADMFWSAYNLTNINSFKNLGKGYTTKTANYNNYTLDLSSCSKLTKESLIDIITNGLYDLNLTYNVANGGTLYTQKLVLGSTNMAKLSSEELSIATSKGWVVS